MTRYSTLFNKLKLICEGAFVPFIVLGDPNISLSLNIVDILINSGADALELGIPFSDPLADGHIIQDSVKRALNAKTTPDNCFNMIITMRRKHPNTPFGLLVYANLIFSMGIRSFYSRCSHVGIDSVLIVDLPIEESALFQDAARDYNISLIFICPPNANKNLIYKIKFCSNAYIYLLSRFGVTGNNDNTVNNKIHNIIKILTENINNVPILQGFGISKPIHVRNALKLGVNGVISGSAIMDIIAQNIHFPKKMFTQLIQFVHSMKIATKYHV